MDYIINDLGLNVITKDVRDPHQQTLMRYPFAVTMLLAARQHKVDPWAVVEGLKITSSHEQASILRAVDFFTTFPDKMAMEYKIMGTTAAVIRESFPSQALVLDQIFVIGENRIGFLFPVRPTPQDQSPDLAKPPWAGQNLDFIWAIAPKGIIGWVNPSAGITMLQVVDSYHQPGEAIRILSGDMVKEMVFEHMNNIASKGLDDEQELGKGVRM